MRRLRATSGLRLWGGLGCGVGALLRAVPDRGHTFGLPSKAVAGCFVGSLEVSDATALLQSRWPQISPQTALLPLIDAFDRAPGALARATKLQGAWQHERIIENPEAALKEVLQRTPSYRQHLIQSQSALPMNALRVFKAELLGLRAPLLASDLDQLEQRLGSASMQALFDLGFVWANGEGAFVSRLVSAAWPKPGSPTVLRDEATVRHAESINRGYYGGTHSLADLEAQSQRVFELKQRNEHRDPALAIRAGLALEPILTHGQDTLLNLSRFYSWAEEAKAIGHIELQLEAEWAATKILLSLGRLKDAVALTRSAESSFARLEDPRLAVGLRVALAHGLLWSEQGDEAHALLIEAEAIAHEELGPYYQGLCTAQRSLARTRMRDFQGAAEILDTARERATYGRSLRAQAFTELSAGVLAASQDLPDAAAVHLRDSAECFAGLGEWSPSGTLMARSALNELVVNKPEQAAATVQHALHSGRPSDRGLIDLHIVGLRAAERNDHEALQALHRTALLRLGLNQRYGDDDRELLQPVLLPLKLQIADDGSWVKGKQGTTSFSTRHTLRAILFALVEAREHGLAQDELSAAAWTGKKKGSLHTAIWTLRKVGVPVETTKTGYCLPPAGYRVGKTVD